MTNDEMIEALHDLPFEQALDLWTYMAQEEAEIRKSLYVLNDPRFVTWCSAHKADLGRWLDGQLGPHPRRTKP